MNSARLLAGLATLSVVAWAEAPLPQLKIEATDGGSIVHIHNSGGQPLTAYLLELVDYPGSHFTDFTDEVAREPIAAGTDRTYHVKNMTLGAAPDYVKVTAAIYADGISSGDPKKVQKIVERRTITLQTTRELLQRFGAAESKEALSETLKQWSDSLPVPPRSKSVNKENASPGAAAAAIASARTDLAEHSLAESLEHLRRTEAALARSKPNLSR